MNRSNKTIIFGMILLSITVPYLLAAWLGGQTYQFTGFLLNPTDGASYLAKMYQGWSGSWRFTLPFTAEAGQGAYLFVFYLFLGHLARWTTLPLIITFHLARLLGAGLLVFALLKFLDHVFPHHPELYRAAFWLTALGSGMGWLLVFSGLTPVDFWVAEAYPFLSMFSNPHFPIGLALLLWVLVLMMNERIRFRNICLALAGLLLSVILPFGLVVALVVAAGSLLWIWAETGRLQWMSIVFLAVFGGPFLLYQFWASMTDPVLAGWNAQNLTPSPYIWDFLFSFSPSLLLAPFGVWSLLRTKEHPARRVLVSWLILGLILIYFPFSLQRRFMLGFYIPCAVLAVFGVDYLRQRWRSRPRLVMPLALGLSFPTNVLLSVIFLFGASSHSPELYLSIDEVRAFDWMRVETPPHALILASPNLGAWIPGWTGRRVVYGHPFETVNAAQEKERVQDFFSTSRTVSRDDAFLSGLQLDYLIYGPRERKMGGKLDLSSLLLVYETGTVQIFSVEKAP